MFFLLKLTGLVFYAALLTCSVAKVQVLCFFFGISFGVNSHFVFIFSFVFV